MNKQKGFTLVELLVVIAIIAVLAGAVLIAINPVAMMQKSRDAKRLSDLDQLVRAIHLGLVEGEVTLTAMAAPVTSAGGGQAVSGGGWVRYTVPTGKTGLGKYLSTLPLDPLNTTTYVYSYQSSLTDFEIDAVLESADNTAKMSTDGGNAPAAYEVGTSLTFMAP
jgi:prepilin-type N-terminal cleavage/methylation domain-containing protein